MSTDRMARKRLTEIQANRKKGGRWKTFRGVVKRIECLWRTFPFVVKRKEFLSVVKPVGMSNVSATASNVVTAEALCKMGRSFR